MRNFPVRSFGAFEAGGGRGRGRSRGRRERSFGWCALAMALLATSALGSVTVSERPAEADPTVDHVATWHLQAYQELRHQPPPVLMLHLAMVHGAVYDAVNAITATHEPLLLDASDPEAGSTGAAAAKAAHDVLVHLLPQRAAHFDDALAASLASIPDGPDEDTGIEIGSRAASAMIEARTGDGRFGAPAFSTGTEAGQWRPLSLGLAGNNFAWMGDVRPFVIDDPADFATAGPLDLTSKAYAAEFDEVKALGRATGSSRTADQTEQAYFWADHTVAMWSRIFQQLSATQDLSPEENARYYAMLYTTGADALIACFEDKERHGFWRPLTAIREAATDGNPQTAPDPDWTPLIGNPPYPDHPSGANCATAAFVSTLRDYFGTNRMRFSATHSTLGITRSFTHLSHALGEVRHARVYAGLHFMTADAQGAALGNQVAKWRDTHAFGPR